MLSHLLLRSLRSPRSTKRQFHSVEVNQIRILKKIPLWDLHWLEVYREYLTNWVGLDNAWKQAYLTLTTMRFSMLPLLIWLAVLSCDSTTTNLNSLSGRHLRVIWVVKKFVIYFFTFLLKWISSKITTWTTWMGAQLNYLRCSLVGMVIQKGCLGHSKEASL